MQNNKYSLIVLVLVLSLVLTACGDRTRTVFSNDLLTVCRSGAQITVIDRAENREYSFTLRRVRRVKNAAVTVRTVLQTDAFTITSAGGQWLIEMPEGRVSIKW